MYVSFIRRRQYQITFITLWLHFFFLGGMYAYPYDPSKIIVVVVSVRTYVSTGILLTSTWYYFRTGMIYMRPYAHPWQHSL